MYKMVLLKSHHPALYQEFVNDHFVIQKSPKKFSLIAIDQAHEQPNDVIKGRGRAVGLFDSLQALQRWLVSGPDIVRLIE